MLSSNAIKKDEGDKIVFYSRLSKTLEPRFFLFPQDLLLRPEPHLFDLKKDPKWLNVTFILYVDALFGSSFLGF